MQPIINFDLLRKAYQIVNNVDDSLLELNEWGCGTIACAAGHIACDLEFNTLGFTLEPRLEYSSTLTVRYRLSDDLSTTSWSAVQELFDCDYDMALAVFQGRADDEACDFNDIPEEVEIWINNWVTIYDALTDKQLWQSRIRALFLGYNEPFNF